MAKYIAGKSVYQNCGDYVIVRADDLHSVMWIKVEIPAIIERIETASTLRELRNAVNDLPREVAYDLDHFFFEADLSPVSWEAPYSAGLRYRAAARALTCDPNDPAVNELEDFDWDTRDDLRVDVDSSLRAACVDRIGADPDAGVLPLAVPRIMDTDLCYRVVNSVKELRPYASFATHDLDAGFRDLEKPIAVLRELGHEVVRDDQLIARVCG